MSGWGALLSVKGILLLFGFALAALAFIFKENVAGGIPSYRKKSAVSYVKRLANSPNTLEEFRPQLLEIAENPELAKRVMINAMHLGFMAENSDRTTPNVRKP